MMRVLSLPLAVALTLAAVAPAIAAPAAPAAAPAAPAAPAPAPPKVTPTNDDVRCLMTMFALSQDKSRASAAQSGQVGLFFFAGRLSLHAPGVDLGPMMKANTPSLTGPQLQTELQRCAQVLQTEQKSVQDGFQSLRPPAPPAGAAPAAAPPK